MASMRTAASTLLALSFATLGLAKVNTSRADTAFQAGTNETFVPKVIPLAVRTPYLSTWTVPADDGSLTGGLPEPVFWDGGRQGWGNAIKVDNYTCTWMGDPPSGAHDVTRTGFKLTATQSQFSFTCGAIGFDAIFLSPIEPSNYTLQSLPWSYVSLNVYSNDGKEHEVSFYSDVTTQWVGLDSSLTVEWNITKSKSRGYYYGTMALSTQWVFGEDNDMAEWGEVVYATNAASGLSYQSGAVGALRSAFLTGLTNQTDNNQPRQINSNYPGIAFQVDLGNITSTESPLLFAVGQLRDPAVNFSALGCAHDSCLRHIYSRIALPTTEDQLEFFLDDFASANATATALDAKIRADAIATVSEEYATIVELSARQAMNGMEITVGQNPDGSLKENDVMVFMKEISSDGNVNTVDVMFPNMPALLYLSPKQFHDLLKPGFLYWNSGNYPNKYCGHDLGSSYPNATGHNDGNDEYMPVEESGNFVLMALAYTLATGDKTDIDTYYTLLQQWTKYLVEDGLIPANQVSTDDFAGALANQTNLALKAIVGIQAMSNISAILDKPKKAAHYAKIAERFFPRFLNYSMDPSGKHLELAYGNASTWSLIYNAYPDKLMNLSIVPQSLLELETAWYATVSNDYGVPLDTRHTYTKSDWETWTSVIMTNTETRDLFINGLADFLADGAYSAPLPDWYDTIEGNSDGFADRPVVGGHFAHLALHSLWGNIPSAAEAGLTGAAPFPYPDVERRSEEEGLARHKAHRRTSHVF